MTQEQWGQIRQDLRQVLGQNNFTAWIEPLQFHSLTDGIATFNVPTNFMGNYLTQNYADTILSSMNSAGVAVRRIQFVVASRQQFKAQAAAAPVQAANKVESPASAERAGDMDPARARRWMPVSALTALWWASRTNWPMQPRVAWQKVAPSALTRCFCMVALVWVKRTSCTRLRGSCT